MLLNLYDSLSKLRQVQITDDTDICLGVRFRTVLFRDPFARKTSKYLNS